MLSLVKATNYSYIVLYLFFVIFVRSREGHSAKNFRYRGI